MKDELFTVNVILYLISDFDFVVWSTKSNNMQMILMSNKDHIKTINEGARIL